MGKNTSGGGGGGYRQSYAPQQSNPKQRPQQQRMSQPQGALTDTMQPHYRLPRQGVMSSPNVMTTQPSSFAPAPMTLSRMDTTPQMDNQPSPVQLPRATGGVSTMSVGPDGQEQWQMGNQPSPVQLPRATGGVSTMSVGADGTEQWGPPPGDLVQPKMMDTGGQFGSPQTGYGQQGYGQGGLGALIRALLGGGQGYGQQRYQPQQQDLSKAIIGGPPPGNPVPPPGSPTAPNPTTPTTPTTPGTPTNPTTPTTPTVPGAPAANPFAARPTSASSTGDLSGASLDWARNLGRSNPSLAGTQVSPFDYFQFGPNGAYAGPMYDGWQRTKGYDPNGFTGMKDNTFYAGGVGQIGMLHGWDKPGTPAYEDAWKKLRSQFNIGIPRA